MTEDDIEEVREKYVKTLDDQKSKPTDPKAAADSKRFKAIVDEAYKWSRENSTVGVAIMRGYETKYAKDQMGRVFVRKLKKFGIESKFFSEESSGKSFTIVVFFSHGQTFDKLDERFKSPVFSLNEAVERLKIIKELHLKTEIARLDGEIEDIDKKIEQNKREIQRYARQLAELESLTGRSARRNREKAISYLKARGYKNLEKMETRELSRLVEKRRSELARQLEALEKENESLRS